jgi:hypothetical protein
LVFNGRFSLEKMDPLYFYAFLLKEALQGPPLIGRTTEADPAVGAEMAGNRNEFHRESILPGFLFSPNGVVDGWEEDHRVRHD